ncbi:Uncharacterised protein (plasmid) [Tsukamurella tyrosinosolvens]|uniref:Uncharacterized protein n=1 Tax=Tsukamurella tyrosinosolvens TaxID=57704 RepID=A0A1H4VM63_TSUTY|nr:hypothetical protein [Tsukamurella tyrosinosolvens]KXO90939.1 hypothetical protein AXK58_21130 [Tsukamurella tyrosinosolvens]SEC82107.1 hypothetical protein SAMN04489793_3273 [Tsukamurella tyrosinosolvens]VEH90428.1 Uncharacterised protein [Tsukamurella tyrosinosolvens]
MSEQSARCVDRIIEDALEEAFETIDRYLRSDTLTIEDVETTLGHNWGEAVSEAWDDYCAGD